MDEEIWRPIAGFEDYEISNLGNVRSYKGRVKGGFWKRMETPRLLKPNTSGRYHSIKLSGGKKGKHKTVRRQIHSLVLETFVGPKPEGLEGCHNDSDPSNNRVDNLRWDTHKSNLADREANGTAYCGERNKKSVLNTQSVLEIRRRYLAGELQTVLGKEFGVTTHAIYCVVRRKTWKHIP